MALGTCRFCGETAEIRQSHIIPEFVFRPLYDSKGRALSLPADGRTNYLQKGFRAPLLCDHCEKFFNEKFEKRFKRLYVDTDRLPRVAFRKKYKLAVADYSKLKLFLLSVLWRAGVCDEYPFESIHLGSHEETLRRMLATEDAGEAESFPVFAYLAFSLAVGALPHS